MSELFTLFEFKRPQAELRTPQGSLAFDWAYLLLCVILTLGVALDFWSHQTYGPDQSIFSEYHLMFYTAATLIGLWLVVHLFRYSRAGFARAAALPPGYGLSLFAIIMFGVAGSLDLIGHAVNGFEVGIEAILSPTHVPLFAAWFLVVTGPLRAFLARRGRSNVSSRREGFLHLLPALLSFTLGLTVLSFTVYPYSPISGTTWMVQAQRQENEQVGQLLGVMGVFLQTLLFTGSVLWLVSRLKLPRGALTFILTVFGLFINVLSSNVWSLPVLVGFGLLSDGLYLWLRPSSERPGAFLLFGTLLPVALWGLVYATLMSLNVGGGVWYPPYIWTGSIVEAGILGLLLAFVMLAPASRSAVVDVRQHADPLPGDLGQPASTAPVYAGDAR